MQSPDTKKEEDKVIILEKEAPNPYSIPNVYDVRDVLNWYLDGVTHISVYPDKKRAFLYFAAVNGLLTITSDGHAFVAGMKVTN